MVDRQPTLCNVHGPRVDQPLRRPLQPHLHLWTLTLGDGVPCRLSQLSEEPRSRWIQPNRSRLHNVPRSNLVLPPRRNITGQDRKEHDQAVAGTRSQPHTTRYAVCFRNSGRFALPRNIPVSVGTHRGGTSHVQEGIRSRWILYDFRRNYSSSLLFAGVEPEPTNTIGNLASRESLAQNWRVVL